MSGVNKYYTDVNEKSHETNEWRMKKCVNANASPKSKELFRTASEKFPISPLESSEGIKSKSSLILVLRELRSH